MMKKEAKKWFRLGWYQANGLDEAWRIDELFEKVWELEGSR